jgi:molybdopterin-guanine dinucleotide biosynthesis protein B
MRTGSRGLRDEPSNFDDDDKGGLLQSRRFSSDRCDLEREKAYELLDEDSRPFLGPLAELGVRTWVWSTKKIAIIGSKKSGKTSIAEIVISYFAKQGLTIGTIKHIHHADFTIDREGSDTWRHRRAGAKLVAYFSPSEAGMMLKVGREPESIEEVLRFTNLLRVDLLVIEGFHRLVAKRADVGKIIAFKDLADLEERVKGTEPPIIALCTFNKDLTQQEGYGLEFLVLPRDQDKLIKALEAFMESP